MLHYGHGWCDGGASDFAARNPVDIDAVDAEHVEAYGLRRTTLLGWFLRDIPKAASVLEVGVNTGVQLKVLEHLGYSSLHGCDVSEDVVRRCPYPADVADARALPYADGSFDLVFTSGTLMAVSFDHKLQAARELARVTRRYILGFEHQAYTYIKKVYDRMPPAYLLPIERLWRAVLPSAVMLRSDTWRNSTSQSTFVYLLDTMPLLQRPLL